MGKQHNRTMKLTAVGVLAIAWAVSAGATQVLRPRCLEPIGVRDVAELSTELPGSSVTVGMVELSQTFSHNESEYAFVPNFEHQSLDDIERGGFYCYDRPGRPLCYSTHAGLIAGVLFGDDDDANCQQLGRFHYRGIVPAAAAVVYEANWFIYNVALVPRPQPISADVLSISWGTDANDVVTMWWQRGIDALAQRDGCVIIAACGNGSDRTNAISKPSWGHNIISVGTASGLGQFPDNLRYIGPPAEGRTSCGPTDDGRAKPDIIAPGLSLGPAARGTGEYFCAEQPGQFSSFAAPQVAGVAAMLIDTARLNNIAGGDDPLVIRALLLNGADKLVGWHKGLCSTCDDHSAVLDYRQGAGLVDALDSYVQLIAGACSPGEAGNIGWDLAELVTGDLNDNTDTDVDGAGDGTVAEAVYYMPRPLQAGNLVKATLVWQRHYHDDRLYTPLPLNHLVLQLWAADERGQLLELLDYSAGEYDNLQHIYYKNQENRRVALRITARQTEGAPPAETYALAFYTGMTNWSGDRLAADFDADGIVDIDDLLQLLDIWELQRYNEPDELTETYMPEDLDLDGRVDLTDFDLLTAWWQVKSPWHRP